MSFLLKKGEKLTTALYMVTDIMSEKEPMKWKIRENGVELLSDIAVSYGASASERMSVMSNAIKKIEKIVSFLEITERARMISEMNASVLKKEYLALKDAVEKEWNNIYDRSKSIFSDSFFEVPREPVRELKQAEMQVPLAPRSAPATRELRITPPQAEASQATIARTQPAASVHSPVQSQGQKDTRVEPREREHELQSKREVEVTGQVREQNNRVHPQVQSPRPSHQETFTRDTRHATELVRPIHTPESQALPQTTTSTQRPTLRDASPVRTHGENSSSERRSIILNKIKEKPSLNVRDLADSIPHVSEKTIQRELLAMVSEGLLVKRGERRWSTYSLRIS